MCIYIFTNITIGKLKWHPLYLRKKERKRMTKKEKIDIFCQSIALSVLHAFVYIHNSQLYMHIVLIIQ